MLFISKFKPSYFDKQFNIFAIVTRFLKLRSGFTLIELLVAMGVFTVIGTVALSILFMSLRASRKTDTLITLKQMGDGAVSQIVKNIRYSKNLDLPTSCVTTVSSLDITVSSSTDDGQTTYSCVTGLNSTIASNGASLIDTSKSEVTDCSFTCMQQTLNDPPAIKLEFKLNSKSNSTFLEHKGSVPFQASVTLRNYNR